jgi:TorA maturation chaperone TorD
MSRFELIHQDERVFCYQLLWHYYRGDLLNRSTFEWQAIVKLLKEQEGLAQNISAKRAISLLEKTDETDVEEFMYHYNRLFVGPGRLLASPYESSYRNVEKSVMQQETLRVRNFYSHAGLQLALVGQIPDDHIQYELEFMLHLLNSENEEVSSLFLEKHLLQWGIKHGEDILMNSTNTITQAFAHLLRGFLQLEKMMIEGGE